MNKNCSISNAHSFLLYPISNIPNGSPKFFYILPHKNKRNKPFFETFSFVLDQQSDKRYSQLLETPSWMSAKKRLSQSNSLSPHVSPIRKQILENHVIQYQTPSPNTIVGKILSFDAKHTQFFSQPRISIREIENGGRGKKEEKRERKRRVDIDGLFWQIAKAVGPNFPDSNLNWSTPTCLSSVEGQTSSFVYRRLSRIS